MIWKCCIVIIDPLGIAIPAVNKFTDSEESYKSLLKLKTKYYNIIPYLNDVNILSFDLLK